MPTVTISEDRCKVRGFGYKNRSWAKRDTTLRFDADGIADVSKTKCDLLDLELHDEFDVVEEYVHTFDVKVDSVDEIVLDPGQTVKSKAAAPKKPSAKKPAAKAAAVEGS
jgi:hypothetical protein